MRVTNGLARHRKHKKIIDQAKGYRGAMSITYKSAKQAVVKAMVFSTRDRKQRQRKMRELWIMRINAGARMSGLSYSKFMFGLKRAGIELDRKVLAELAFNNVAEFAKLVEVAKKSI